jgi:hypothetical protein
MKTNIKGGFLVTLPSVTLGKEFLCRVQWPKHSTKKAHLGPQHSAEKLPLPSVKMVMDKYPPGITIPYSYPQQKITPSGHPYPLVGKDLPPYHTHVGIGHPSVHPYPQRLNIYQINTLYKHQVYLSKYHYKISSIIHSITP